MSNAVRLSAKLGKDEELNGLDSIAEELAAAPSDKVFFALTWITCPTVNQDKEHGTRRPTVFIKRIEPLGGIEDVPQHLIDLAARLQERRTGRTPLPFGVIEVIEGRGVDIDERDEDYPDDFPDEELAGG